MADTLVLKGGAPYNIRKEGGQWYFVTTIFGQEYANLPKELRLVPQNLIPRSVNADGKTGYIPESQVITYFRSQDFSDALKVQSTLAGTPSAIAAGQNIANRGYPQTTLAGAPVGKQVAVPTSANSVANAVSSTLSGFNETERVQRFASQKTVVDTATGQKTDRKMMEAHPGYNATFPNSGLASASPWSWAINQARMQTKTGDTKYMYNAQDGAIYLDGKETVFIPGPDGRISSGSVIPTQQFIDRLRNAPRADVIEYQKALGVKNPTGVFTPNEIQAIQQYSRLASYQNLAAAQSGQVSAKPVGVLDYLKQSGTAGLGTSKTTTDVTRNIASFTPEYAQAILQDYYAETIGRAPTAQEAASFAKILNKKAKERPDVSTRTTTTTDGSSTSTVTSKPGFGNVEAQMAAQQQARTVTGATGFLASTKYMDAIMDMIRNPLGV